MTSMITKDKNSMEAYLRLDRLPHMWCAGCGIGPSVGCFVRAIDRAELNPDKVSVVSGIGCSGRAAGYTKLDSFHTTHGRALPFATGLKMGNPELNVVVFSGDGDLAAIGGNHLIHSARRNIDITVICLNNYNYGMTGGQSGPTTPLEARSSTSPYGNYEPPFNLPNLVAACGATYVARWTAMHLRQLERSITEAMLKPGFSFIEVIAPCPTLYARKNKLGQGIDVLHSYQERCVISDGADTKDTEIDLKGPILLGKFVDITRPTLWDRCMKVTERAQKK